jgi:hypothetical protein
MHDREQLRVRMIQNAAEINRLHDRVHETFKRRDQSVKLREEWSRACAEFHARYNQLCLPGGWDAGFYDRLHAGDSDTVEVALCFLEVRPYFFRSGYHWKDILQKCKHAPLKGEQCERFATLLEKYSEWKRLRQLSSNRGAAIRRDLWPLVQHFSDLFPIRLADLRYDGVVNVGDLYKAICGAMKVKPLVDPERAYGTARRPYRPEWKGGANMTAWARGYREWRESVWKSEDIWATLVSAIRDVYTLDKSFDIHSGIVLREPKGNESTDTGH